MPANLLSTFCMPSSRLCRLCFILGAGAAGALPTYTAMGDKACLISTSGASSPGRGFSQGVQSSLWRPLTWLALGWGSVASGQSSGGDTLIWNNGFQGLYERGEELLPRNYTGQAQLESTGACFPNGSCVVGWRSISEGSSIYDLYGQYVTTEGGDAGDVFELNTPASSSSFWMSLASLPGEEIFACWSRQLGGVNSDIRVSGQRLYKNGTHIGSSVFLGTSADRGQLFCHATALSNGNLVATWTRLAPGDSNYEVRAVIFDSQNTPLTAEIPVSTVPTIPQAHSRAAPLLDGGFVIVWARQVFTNSTIYGQLFNSTGHKKGNQLWVSNLAGNHTDPDVASQSDGSFFVTWTAPGSTTFIFGRFFTSAGVAPELPLFISSSDVYVPSASAVAATDEGRYIVTWQSDEQDGSGKGIYGWLWGSNQLPFGEAFRVNTYVTGDQSLPWVAAWGWNEFVIGWQGPDQAGGQMRAYMKRFYIRSTAPTSAPSLDPTAAPSAMPLSPPTHSPSLAPLAAPSGAPTPPTTISPTGAPSQPPTSSPTRRPTGPPTSFSPTPAPTAMPTPTPPPTFFELYGREITLAVGTISAAFLGFCCFLGWKAKQGELCPTRTQEESSINLELAELEDDSLRIDDRI